MRKSKQVKNHTTNSRVYKMASREGVIGCPICPPNRGCNRNWSQNTQNWKGNRKNQWRD